MAEQNAVLAPHVAHPAPPEPGVKRKVTPLNLVHVQPGLAETSVPTFREVEPGDLLVDESYQRQISERSLELIRRIVAQWDWRRFKPPVVAETEDGLVVLDGQHTAIAAATHPLVTRIPVMVVEAADRTAQAKAFVGHNKDRLGITQMQMHHAALAAGDEDALTIDQVCQRAGVKILRTSPGGGVFKPGETVAVLAIGALINRRGAQKARIVLQVLADARCAPVSAGQIKAVELLLHGQDYKGEVEPGDITSAILALGVTEAEREARVFAAAHKTPLWQALAVVLFRKARRGRRRAD